MLEWHISDITVSLKSKSTTKTSSNSVFRYSNSAKDENRSQYLRGYPICNFQKQQAQHNKSILQSLNRDTSHIIFLWYTTIKSPNVANFNVQPAPMSFVFAHLTGCTVKIFSKYKQ